MNKAVAHRITIHLFPIKGSVYRRNVGCGKEYMHTTIRPGRAPILYRSTRRFRRFDPVNLP